MKVLVVLSVAFALVAAIPQKYEEYRQVGDLKLKEELVTSTVIPIIRLDKEQGTDGSYKSSYETGNHIVAQEEGYWLASENSDENPGLVQRGSYSYVDPDGNTVSATYVADKNGFRIEGDHIPTAAPVSPEIQKSLDLIYAGIEYNKKRDELERQNNPEAGKKQDEKAALNYKGQYYSQ